jgi:hypothetical protein
MFSKVLVRSIAKPRVFGLALTRASHVTRAMSSNSNSLLSGFASVDGTKSYLASKQLNLYHKFERTNLFIGPIVYGPPGRQLPAQQEMECFAYAIGRNGSNCCYVYDHNSGTYGVRQGHVTWHQRGISEVLNAVQATREEIVTIAGLGKVPSTSSSLTSSSSLSPSDILTSRLEEACQLTGLEKIDIALVEVNEKILTTNIDSIDIALKTLEKLVVNGKIKAYGILCDVGPYNRHTPTPSSSPSNDIDDDDGDGDNTKGRGMMMLPYMLEKSLERSDVNCEIIAYTISPTTQTPATYPMLTPMFGEAETVAEWRGTDNNKIESADHTKQPTGAGVDDDDDEEYDEEYSRERTERTLTRMAIDGFLARHGEIDLENENSSNFPAYPLVDIAIMSQDVGEALNELCPELATTPRLQDKVLRAVLSVGIDCVVADAEMAPILDRPHVLAKDLLHSDDTDDIFGTFIIPEELIYANLNDMEGLDEEDEEELEYLGPKTIPKKNKKE